MTYPNLKEPGFIPEPNSYRLNLQKVLTQEMRDRFDLIAKLYLERYMDQCWIDDGEFKGWRWEKFNTVRRVAGVANRYGGLIVMGTRHYSNLMCAHLDALAEPDLLREWAGDENCEQGFVDQYGTFLDRKEAWILAEANNQIVYRDKLPEGTLYSEHLW